jgi:hypothetical protein
MIGSVLCALTQVGRPWSGPSAVGAVQTSDKGSYVAQDRPLMLPKNVAYRPWRHARVPLVRKRWSFGKEQSQMRRRVVLFQAFDNVARPPMRWCVPLPDQDQRFSGLIRPKWVHRTPGIAAGIPDHVWTFRELLTAKAVWACPVPVTSLAQLCPVVHGTRSCRLFPLKHPGRPPS